MSFHCPSARTALALFALTLAALGCSSGGDSGGVTSPPPLAWTSLIGQSWTHGFSAHRSCTQLQVPADLYIKGFRTTATRGEYRLFLSESATRFMDIDGDFDCDADTFGTRLLYASGQNTPDISFPQDVGVHVQAGEYLLLNLQLVSDSGSTEVLIQSGRAADVTQTADVLLSGTRDIVIPAHQTGTSNGGCSAASDFDILAAMPLMSLQAVSQTLGVHGSVVQSGPYTLTQQGYTAFQPAIPVHANDSISVACTFDNTSGDTLFSGDDMESAACYNVIYRSPAPDHGTYFGCVD